MDTVFSLVNEADRASYLQSLMQVFNCNYICLWLYLPQPTHNLYFLDGYYNENNNQASSSSGSLARRLFGEYQREVIFIVNDRVPGMAFLNNLPYKELTESELGRMASVAVQGQFYREARIKTAVFMGCRSGEIEMGWSNTQINMENTMRNWFSEEISHRKSPVGELSQPVDKNRPSSSSSSLRSLSMDSPDSSSFLFNIPTTTSSHMPEVVVVPQEVTPFPLQLMPSTSTAIIQQAAILQTWQSIQSTGTTSPLHHSPRSLQPIPTTTHQQAMQDFALSRNVQLPSQESEDAAMTRAILAVLTSPSSSTSSSTPPHNLPYHYRVRQRDTAFKSYLSPTTTQMRPTGSRNRQSLLKRAITYYTSLNIVRREHMQASRPTTTQLHHMISERKRREKINESFEALRKLLPPDAKKDKASVLTRTTEYLTSLKAQVAELSQRKQQLETQVQVAAKTVEAQAQVSAKVDTVEVSESSNERVEVRVTHLVSESTSEDQRTIDLQVVVRRESNGNNASDVVIRILEFLKQVRNVNLMSMEATTRTTAESRSYNRVILRLRIEGNQWDESAFQEAVRRVVADLAQ